MATTQTAPKKKGLINFDFLQKLGKVLMTVIAVMPAAGLMIMGTGTFNHQGTSGQKISFQYVLVPKILTARNVHTASTIVIAMLPVTFAPPGNTGINPIRLFMKIKKNAVSK